MARRRGGKAPAPPTHPARTRWIAAAAIVLVVVAAALVWWRRTDSGTSLSPLPDLTGQTPAVVQHLRERHDAARRARTAAAIGNLCVAYHADMLFGAAESCYSTVRQLDPANWKWAYFQALIHAERGGGDTLIEALQRIVRQEPGYSPAWLRLGDAAFKAGDYETAAKAWAQAVAVPEPARTGETPAHLPEAPIGAYASLGIARVALAREDVGSARAILEEIVANAVDFGPAWRLLAQTYDAQQASPAARHAIAVADHLPEFTPYADPIVDELARESRNSTFLLRLSSEASLGVNAAWSEFLARRALQFDPANPDVVSKLARILRTVGRNEEALGYFRRYNEMVPGDYQGLAQTGSCLSALGRYDEAEKLLRQALPHLDDAMTHYNVGLLLAQTGRGRDAEQEYRTALERDPSHVDARINLANLLARTGRRDAAIGELQRLLEDDPNNALARANLAALR